MIVVESTISWREKLRWLRDLFSCVRVKVIATTRTPSQHAPSAYAGMQPTTGWRDFDAFMGADQSARLDPSVLYGAIIQAGLAPAERTSFFDFDALVNEEFRPLAAAIPGLAFPDVFSHLNTRQKVGDALVSRPAGAYDLGYRAARRRGPMYLGAPKLRRGVDRILRALPITRRRKLHVRANAATLDRLGTLDRSYGESSKNPAAYHYSDASAD